ncbi:hypothetical protein [Paraburkholderia azotifigens]|uniref:Uncharacterized protein n=1 Tax=Paraburkholderia azotifigens TaxID=2057004 RepID=A0A5C6VLL2_9BURK|nr:hypothetical protein [Paraburkholderia azotifigens]TXC86293.1 hypothetical protein FRZ40_01140 [Paraburkholderia azotifigens]
MIDRQWNPLVQFDECGFKDGRDGEMTATMHSNSSISYVANAIALHPFVLESDQSTHPFSGFAAFMG